MAKRAEEVILCRGHKNPLLNCSGQKKESDYYLSWSPFNTNGRYGYCKECCDKMFQFYTKDTGSMQAGIWAVCAKVDAPFIAEIYEKVNNRIKENNKNNRKTNNVIGLYLNELGKCTTRKEVWRDFSDTDVDLSDVNTKIKSRELKQQEIDQFELDWGVQPEITDYEFLEYRFNEYTNDKELTVAEEGLYRSLCKAELGERRAFEKGDSTKEYTDTKLKLMDKLKISNFDERKDKSDIDKILERQIWEIENTEPAEMVDKEEYKDYLGIKNTWWSHIVRAVRNLIAGSSDYPDVTKEDWD